MTRGEALLRSWVKSRIPALQLAFAAYAWGKPPEKIEAEGLQPKTRLILHYAHELDAIDADAVDADRFKKSQGEFKMLAEPQK